MEKLEGDVGRSCKVRADAERGCFGPVEDRKAVLQVSKVLKCLCKRKRHTHTHTHKAGLVQKQLEILGNQRNPL